jgi:hypothetical protein
VRLTPTPRRPQTSLTGEDSVRPFDERSATAATTKRVLFGHLNTEDAASAVARRLRTAIGPPRSPWQATNWSQLRALQRRGRAADRSPLVIRRGGTFRLAYRSCNKQQVDASQEPSEDCTWRMIAAATEPPQVALASSRRQSRNRARRWSMCQNSKVSGTSH